MKCQADSHWNFWISNQLIQEHLKSSFQILTASTHKFRDILATFLMVCDPQKIFEMFNNEIYFWWSITSCWDICNHNDDLIRISYIPNTGTWWVKNEPHSLSILTLKHTEAETKWSPFHRRRFQMHFVEWKFMNFD